MRSLRRGSSRDVSLISEQSIDSFRSIDRMSSEHSKNHTNESSISNITCLVRRSFPRPFGKSSRQNLQASEEFTKQASGEITKLSSFRSTMYDAPSSATMEIETEVSPSKSNQEASSAIRDRILESTSSFLELSMVDEEVDHHSDAGESTHDRFSTELAALEDLLNAPPGSPTRLLSRGFPLTATLGSSFGSANSFTSPDFDNSHTETSHANNCDIVEECSSVPPNPRLEVNAEDVQSASTKKGSSHDSPHLVELRTPRSKKSKFLSKLFRRPT